MAKPRAKPAILTPTGLYRLVRYTDGVRSVVSDTEYHSVHAAQRALTVLCGEYRPNGRQVLPVGNLDVATVTNGHETDLLRTEQILA